MPRRKEGIWKQVTLNRKLALEYCRSGSRVKATRIEFGRALDFGEKYEMPEWAVQGNKDCMILHDVNRGKMPLLVTSAPAQRFIIDFVVQAEEQGAVAKQSGGVMSIDLEEEVAPAWKFIKDESAGKWAPYQVVDYTEEGGAE